MPPAARQTPLRVAAIRRFNRFYTRQIGVLSDGWLDSTFSLSEARVLYEIKQRGSATASEIGRDLGLDAGYLSRMLRDFHERGLISKHAAPGDARQSLLAMTAVGLKAFAPLEERTKHQVSAMLSSIAAPDQDRLVAAMQTIETLLDGASTEQPKVSLRQPRSGDFGIIVSRHALLYAQEYGWTGNFEGLCAQIVADFVNHYDAARERCWIAETDGRYAGSVMLVKDKDDTYAARLRLLLVEPAARGLGIGKLLTDECLAFARSRGYRTIKLWTHEELTAARRIYERAGFTLVSSERRKSWGRDVVSEQWELRL